MKTRKSKAMTSRQLLMATLPPRGHIEVRERRDGTYSVFYPDMAFIPCPPVCRLKEVLRTHKCDREQGFVESNLPPTDFDAAMEWATFLAEEREVKVIPR